jgi:lipoprotein-anchoring transpeptidase ErfK/SrfK
MFNKSYNNGRIKRKFTVLTLAVFVIAAAVMAGACAGQQAVIETEPTEAPASQTAEPTPSLAPTATPTPVPTPVPTTTPMPYPQEVKKGAQGEDASMLQDRLSELGYYLSDEARGTYGEKTAVAVAEFQRQNDLERTGEADAQTCLRLFSDSALKCVPFSSLAPTINMTFEELAGDDGLRDQPEGYPAADTYYVIVDIAHQVVMVYAKDGNGEYTVPVRYMLCSTGLGNRTPRGVFELDTYKLRFSKFDRDGRFGQYWTQIYGAFYFHTFLYTKLDAASYDADTYLELGGKASHGCVRLTVPDARWMWYNIGYGTKCEIRNGSEDDVATAMIREQLVLPPLPEQRVDIKAGEIPNTDNWSIADVKIDLPYKQGSQN